MKRFIKLIKDKWLRQTSLTLLLVAIILALFILINLVLKKLDLTPIDFTSEKIYTLSEESKDAVKDIEQNVSIFFFGYKEDSKEIVLAKQYHDVNDKIEVKLVTVTERPDLATMYGVTTDEQQLIAIASSQRYKAISSSELYTYDMSTGQDIDVTEQKITNGILDVTISSKPQIYFLIGHNEYGISEEGLLYYLRQYIENDVNDVKELDLLSSDMPEQCDLLVIANPQIDFTDIETEKIKNYIEDGGNIIWLQDPYITINNYSTERFANTNKILAMYGISFSKGVVYENSADKMLLNSPDLIIPNLTYKNGIVKDIYSDGSIVLMDSGKITNDEEAMDYYDIIPEVFIQTSKDSYYIENFYTNERNEDGKYIVGELLTKKVNDEITSKMIAIANAYFVTNDYIPLGNTYLVPITLRNNKDIVTNSVAYLSNREDSLRIRKNTGLVTFETPTEVQNTIVKVVVFGIPVLIVIIGIIISIIRRKK